ncbi:hypothetical protein [Halospeciosus flavus]|uniref:FUN14 family protein n=1 Tax=Halospeciosus flavus TaxID=3032283 RepID=A0ABD5Z904_9EURY|nr:hypothetical protein [Halospeciosus flavus]
MTSSDDTDQRSVGSGNSLTFTELHAAILGTVVGVFGAFVFARGFRTVGVALGAAFVGFVLGFDLRGRAESRVEPRVEAAELVLQREPWYALGAFVVAGALVLFAL